jgi:hypothetical protein
LNEFCTPCPFHQLQQFAQLVWVLIFQDLGFRVLRIFVEELGGLGFKGSQYLGFKDLQ